MKTLPLHLQYREMVSQAWAELPHLTGQFIARAANEANVSRRTMECAVAEALELPSYAAFESLCALLARVYPHLADNQPEDLLHHIRHASADGDELRGQAWAALQTWRDGGWAAVAQLEWRQSEPLELIPYEQLASDAEAPSRAEAFGVLLRFLEEACNLRERVLDGFVVCKSSVVTEDAVNHALDMADVLARSVDSDVPQLTAALLSARGIQEVSEDELAEMWDDASGFTVEDWSLLERAEDPGLDQHAERLERMDAGHPSAWQLRIACMAFSPSVLGGYYDDAPTLFGVLSQAPNEARFRVNALEAAPHEYLVPAVHYLGFVRTLDEVPGLLRCAPRMPADLEVVTHEQALRMGFPALAGWYRLDWSNCL